MKHRFSVVVRRGLSALFLMMICCVMPLSALAQDVAPLLRTHWGQGAPYNALCPVVDGRQSLAGCGPVAMAQVMCGTAHGATSTHDGVAYEWSLIPDRLTPTTPADRRQAVAALLREVMRLRVEGALNAADIAWLRQLCTPKAAGGADGRLAVVDLHDAHMEYLPDSTFFGASRLVDMRLPEGLKVIGVRAFKNCMQLNRVDIPSSVWKIRWEAFRRCRNLLDIHIPEGVRNVLSSTFAECENLTGVRLPESVDTLGESVFRNCARLEKLYIPARTTHIGPFLTRGCPNVEVQLSAHNEQYRMADGRMEHRDAKGKWVPADTPMPAPKGPRRDVMMPGPGSKVVKRYKMVNGKKVFLGVVGNDGRLKR